MLSGHTSFHSGIAATRRVFLLLTALRYLPLGLLIPLFVRYPTQAGLSLADVGVLFATLTACVVALELPTGGLADSWGRRRTLILASAAGVTALSLMVVADSRPVFLLAFAMTGVHWALDSGPLEAWYVDAALDIEPGRDMTADLSRGASVLFAAVAAGSLGASVLAVVPLPVDGLRAAVTTAVILQTIHLLGVTLLVRGEPRRRTTDRRASVAVTVRAALYSCRRRPLRLLLTVQIFWGSGLTVVELLWQPVTAQRAGGGNDWIFGVMAAAGWASAAGGAVLLRPLIRLLGGSVARAAAVLRVGHGLALLPLAMAGGLAGVVVGYLAVYLVQGPATAAHATLLNRHAESSHRATLLSLDSLICRLSGLLTSLGAGMLAAHAGAPVVLAITVVIFAAAVPFYLASGEPPAAGAGVADESVAAGTSYPAATNER